MEKCVIHGFTGKGIDAQPSTTSHLFVSDTTIRNNQGPNGGAIFLKPVAPALLLATIEDVRMHKNRYGIRVEDGGKATVRDSVATGNGTNGYVAYSAGGLASLMLERSVASDNTNNGVSAMGANATIRLSNMTVVANGTGLNPSGGAILSFGNKSLSGNGTDGAPTGPIAAQ